MFPCHKTTIDGEEEDEEGNVTSARMIGRKTRACAGAIEWQKKHGLSPQYVQVLERLSMIQKMTQPRHKEEE